MNIAQTIGLVIASVVWFLFWGGLGIFYVAIGKNYYPRMRWQAFVIAYTGVTCIMISLNLMMRSLVFTSVTGIVLGVALLFTGTIPYVYRQSDDQSYKLWPHIGLCVLGVCFVGLGATVLVNTLP